MAKPKPKPTAERRRSSLRIQAQAWFEALQRHIAEIEGAEAIATLIKGWTKPEDIMRAYPALVPLFLDIVWRARNTPAFTDLLRTAAGEVAEKPSDILAMSQKSFDEIVVAHLLGTMRLTCERLQKEWIATEREKRRGALSKMPVVGVVLRGLGLSRPIKVEILLADYPQRGLYEALKPFLSRREQFGLVEALAALPTRTAAALGAIVGAVDSPAILRSIAGLNRGDMKIALEMAETFVQAVNGGPAAQPDNEAADPAMARALALSDMLRAGTSFVTVAAANRHLANDAVTKFAPVMKAEIWATLGDAESLRRVAECPPAVAEVLQALAVEMNQRVSMALSELPTEPAVAVFAMKTLRDGANPEKFLAWIRTETYLAAWKQFVVQINREAGAPRPEVALGSLVKTSINVVCERSLRAFAEVEDPQKKAA